MSNIHDRDGSLLASERLILEGKSSMRGVRKRAPPYGFDAANPPPELGWRQKRERYPLEADDSEVQSAASPPALRFLRSARAAWAPKAAEYVEEAPESIPEPKPPQQPTAHRRAAAARTRDYRQRLRSGRALLQVEVPIIEVEQLLVDAGLLSPDCDDRPTVEAALGKLIALLVADGDTSRHGIL
jgi:hypothetical protein